MQALFHRRIRVAEELLEQVYAQHHLRRKGRASAFTRRCVGRNEAKELGPRNNSIHLRKKRMLTGAYRVRIIRNDQMVIDALAMIATRITTRGANSPCCQT